MRIRRVIAAALTWCVCAVAVAQNGTGTPLAGAKRGDLVRVELKSPAGRTVTGNLLELRSDTFVLEQRGHFLGRYHKRLIDYAKIERASFSTPAYRVESPGIAKAVIVVSVVAVAALVVLIVALSHAHVD